MIRWTRKQKRVFCDAQRLRPAAITGQRQQQQIKPPGFLGFHQPFGQILTQPGAKAREIGAQPRHQAGQQKGADGRDHAKADRARKRLPRRACGFHAAIERGQRHTRALDEFRPKRREDRLLGAAPFQDRGIQLAFKRDHASG